ncbi:hypothetical protein L202_04541 [Cryptococcus amylolentus CBS 6039]|uniref:BZIP domain-containing protein n=1 Tax=Cryptococcus amylolentus CBS 6039 TaxID=1295533 RepID=A0A1E3HRT0_9TREE|nr:hypothetical protein L202_04541 [Cryptococcus amylolentus CBS 6039]ODN79037.1 hypothetical protein L202_04541 [Cryptococcus amylolentus CBS 6039]
MLNGEIKRLRTEHVVDKPFDDNQTVVTWTKPVTGDPSRKTFPDEETNASGSQGWEDEWKEIFVKDSAHLSAQSQQEKIEKRRSQFKASSRKTRDRKRALIKEIHFLENTTGDRSTQASFTVRSTFKVLEK